MAKINFQSNPKVRNIFDDLDTYRQFCVDFGYKFDEATLYDMRSYAYRQHQKNLAGKPAKDNWEEAITR
jgi:hypothetical protein